MHKLIASLQRWLAAPRFTERSLTRRAEVIHVVILTHAFTILLGSIAVPIFSDRPWPTLIACLIWASTTGLAWWLNRQGRLTAAAISACLPVYLLVSAVMLVSVPVRGATWYFGAVLHTVIVGGTRWGLTAAFGGLAVLAVTASGLAHQIGLPVIFPHAQASFLVAFLGQLVMVVTPVLLVLRQQRKALDEADAELASRREAENQLCALNEQLEARVEARTAELATANADLESYSYSVSHDLRAPLNAVQGFATLLKERTSTAADEKASQYLDRILTASDRMRGIIDDLLSLAKVARTPLAQRDIDLTKLANEVTFELEHTAPERKVQWQIGMGMRAVGDPGLIRIALENLLGNAWKYTAKTERTVISFSEVSRSGNRVEFLINDNGAGFDNAHAKQLFMPFRRLHSEREFHGSGVGLATVRRILVKHGGSIRGDGVVGGGARFWFDLPTTIQG